MKPDIELLKRTIHNQRFKMLQLLLEVGFDLNSRDSRGSTILHHAVTQCGFEWPTGGMGSGIICRKPARRRLVRDVKVIRPQNLSAPCRKQEIIRDDAEETLRYLIDIGADVNAMDGQGHTPLYLAQKSYYASAAEQILLDNGATSERGVL
jgi:ankyrin repeat protein